MKSGVVVEWRGVGESRGEESLDIRNKWKYVESFSLLYDKIIVSADNIGDVLCKCVMWDLCRKRNTCGYLDRIPYFTFLFLTLSFTLFLLTLLLPSSLTLTHLLSTHCSPLPHCTVLHRESCSHLWCTHRPYLRHACSSTFTSHAPTRYDSATHTIWLYCAVMYDVWFIMTFNRCSF